MNILGCNIGATFHQKRAIKGKHKKTPKSCPPDRQRERSYMQEYENSPILTHNQVVLGSSPLGPPKSSSCK